MSKKSVLVVDDEAMVRDLLRELLIRNGFDVFVAENGVKAFRLLETEKIDCIITDIIMPEKEGLESITELRESYPNLPIIAMSGGGIISGVDYLELAKELGAAKIFKKPFNRTELVDAVKDLVG